MWKCKTCGEDNPELFYATIATYCKVHWRKRVKLSRKRNIEHYKKYDQQRAMDPDRVALRKRYAATPEGKEAGKRARKNWQERNILKRAAHIVVGNSVREGKLVKQPCEVCGKKKVQAHHDDYSKPLLVRWLCTKHHAEHHRKDSAK
jgi:ribosomal protein S27AE